MAASSQRMSPRHSCRSHGNPHFEATRLTLRPARPPLAHPRERADHGPVLAVRRCPGRRPVHPELPRTLRRPKATPAAQLALAVSTPTPGRNADDATERSRERRLICEARLDRDVGERELGAGQQLLGAFDP